MNDLLLHKFNIKQVLFLILPFFLVSCFGENEYEIALKEYVKEDKAINDNRKEYELASLKTYAEERPMEFEALYIEAKKIHTIVSEFENFLLKSEDIDEINIECQEVKEKIAELNLQQFKFLKDEFTIKPLSKVSEKYNLISRLKNLNFDRYNILLSGGCNLSPRSSYKTRMLASRLNDSVVVLNIYSRLLREYNFNDEGLSLDLSINGITNPSTFIGYYIRPSTSCAAYLVKSKSDTLFVDAILKTDELAKLVIAKNSSYIKVGELKEFEENYLEDYFKQRYN
jgi:hypothetical protein